MSKCLASDEANHSSAGRISEQMQVLDAWEVVSNKWSVVVLVGLIDGSKRYNELRRLSPVVSSGMLSKTLFRLERDGMIHREVANFVPVRVDYSLTTRGRAAAEALEKLTDWVCENYELIASDRLNFGGRR